MAGHTKHARVRGGEVRFGLEVRSRSRGYARTREVGVSRKSKLIRIKGLVGRCCYRGPLRT